MTASTTFGWLVRRELWEHRSLYVVPLVIAALVTFAAFYGLVFGMSSEQRHVLIVAHANRFSAEQLSALMGVAVSLLAIPFNIALLAVVFFYLLDALYSDRRNRSILFFKSLPVTDTTTVLSKFVVATVVAPVIVAVVVIGCTALVWLIEGVAVALAGGAGTLIAPQPGPLASGILVMLYVFVVQSLWLAPVFAWLLLASAWAGRAPILWALAPPALLMYLEGLTTGTRHVADLVGYRLGGYIELAFRGGSERGKAIVHGDADALPGTVLSIIDPLAVIASPGLWTGLVAAAALLVASVWLRRYRDES